MELRFVLLKNGKKTRGLILQLLASNFSYHGYSWWMSFLDWMGIV